MVNIPVNKYQTEITEELLNTLPKEVQDELIDIINTVPYVRSLISPNRQYAKDRPRDKEGKIIVDLINPHILEDMDYFRPIALHFKEHGTLTNLRPNANPNSEYGKWLREEKRRIWDGMVRPEDGEWVTGYFYWYLNYAPILLNKIRKGTKVADRIEDMPECWEGVYLRFHYIDQARNGGIYNNFLGGNHGSELASRGKAFAYSQEIETPEGRKKWRNIKIGDYLFAPDGSLTRVIDIPFDELHDVYKMELIDGRIIYTTLEHLWKINNKDKLYTTEDILNSNQIQKFAIENNKGVEYYKTVVPIKPYLLGTILGDNLQNRIQDSNKKETLNSKLEILNLKNTDSYNTFIPSCYKYNSRENRIELLKGLLEIENINNSEFYTLSKQLAEDIMWVIRSLGYNTSLNIEYSKSKNKDEKYYVVSINTNVTYIKSISYSHKEMCKCVTVDREDGLFLIGDFITTHNSKSYSMASILAHNFILGENNVSYKDTTSIVTAYQKEYLTKEGVLNKFLNMADFCSKYTQFPRKRIKNSIQEMVWRMGYIDVATGIEKGSKNQVIGVSSKDDESKLRGKRAVFIGIEEFGCHIKGTKVLMYDGSIKNVEDIQVGELLMGDDNTPRVVEKLYNGTDQLYKITLSNGDYQIVNSHHPVFYKKYNWNTKEYTEHLNTCPELLDIKNLNKGYYIPKAILNFPTKETKIDPYYLGLWLGDGDSTRLDIANEDREILEWLQSRYVGNIRDLNQSDTCKIFHMSMIDNPYSNYFKEYNLFNNKHIPNNFKINNNNIQLQVIAGLIDSDGSYHREKNYFEITQKYTRKHILEDIKFMCECNGLKCSLSKRISTGKKKGVLHYRLRISGDLSMIPTKIERKKGILNTTINSRKNWNDYTFKVEPYKVDEFYGFTVDKNHLFVLGDMTITHNTFPRLVDLYNVLIPSVQEGDIIFGFMYLQGTAGDNESDFAGAQEIMYSPKGYNMYALKNVYDKQGQGKPDFVFFFPGYMNRKGCYDKNGVSDVVAALIEILMNRHRVKYNSSDPNTIVKTKAEVPITPSEAIVKTTANMFPVVDLTERLGQLDNNPREYDDVFVGELTMDKGTVTFKPTGAFPIRDYPLKDNKAEGALEILKMPELDRNNKPFAGRYILSCDPYDDDSADTMSLGSIYVLDLWTDTHVAYYTGRPMFADDFYEIARRMCLFYNGRMNYENNKKGLFAYFSRMNSLYLLTDVLDFLKDKDMVKGQMYGNKAHPYSEKVYTPHGIKKWGDINVGDWLYNTKGGITRVIDVPFDSITDIYEITLKDGRKVRASKNHLWNVIDWNGYSKILSTTQIKHNYYREKGKYKEYKYYIPSNMGVEYNSIKVKLPPYFMGIMLGDGCFTNSRHNQAYFTSTINDMSEYKNNIPFAYKTRDNRHHCWIVPNIGKILIEYGLQEAKSHTKFIPNEYKYNSKEVRLEVLQGLLDTDGHVGYGGNPEYVTVSNKLCDDVIEVARSLGINCNKQVSVNSYGKVYKVIFYTNIKLFKLTRKASRQRITKTRAYKTAIVNIEYIGKEKSKCVTVDSNDSCYLIGDFITTHNSKGTIATAPVNAYGRMLLRNWLLKPTILIEEIDGEPVETTVPNLYKLRDRALIKELINFNDSGNFDRISSHIMLMLLREERLITYQGNLQGSKNEIDADYLGNDKFFKDNYKERLPYFIEQ